MALNAGDFSNPGPNAIAGSGTEVPYLSTDIHMLTVKNI
jgi:hypothetical protein